MPRHCSHRTAEHSVSLYGFKGTMYACTASQLIWSLEGNNWIVFITDQHAVRTTYDLRVSIYLLQTV
eukprot:6644152-Pyramimonas_sp.AAC.1